MARSHPAFVLCLSNEGYPASLETRKLYRVLSDDEAERSGLLRVVDESGQDHLYPASLFARIELPADVAAALGGDTRDAADG